MPPLEGYKEKVKEGKGLKILTPKKFLIRLLILLAHIKARNNPDKLKNESRQILFCFCMSTIKSLKKFITIQSSHYKHGRKYDCNMRSQNFLF